MIGESQITGPHGSGKAGATEAPAATTLIGTVVEVEVGFSRDVGTVAESLRTLGAARSGNVADARKDLAEIETIHAALLKQKKKGFAEAVEQDHHGRPSFRVAGRIYATLWDAEHMNVMLDDHGIRTAVQAHPGECEEVWWGKRLAAVRVTLASTDADLLVELLNDAWEGKAPARLVRRLAAENQDG